MALTSCAIQRQSNYKNPAINHIDANYDLKILVDNSGNHLNIPQCFMPYCWNVRHLEPNTVVDSNQLLILEFRFANFDQLISFRKWLMNDVNLNAILLKISQATDIN